MEDLIFPDELNEEITTEEIIINPSSDGEGELVLIEEVGFSDIKESLEELTMVSVESGGVLVLLISVLIGVVLSGYLWRWNK